MNTIRTTKLNAHLHIEPRLKGRHVVHPREKGDRLRRYHNGVDREVRQHELRNNGTGGNTRPFRPEQLGDRVDRSVLVPGDTEPGEVRVGLQVLCSSLNQEPEEGGQREGLGASYGRDAA